MKPDDNAADHSKQQQNAEDVAPILQQSEPEPTEPERQSETAASDDANQPPLKQARTATAENLRLLVSLRWWIKLSQVVIALATVATVVITYWQWQALKDANTAATNAANAAVSAAGTAATALTDSRDQFAKTLEQMKGQTIAAKEAAAAAKTSADASVVTADAANVQAGASKAQAGAAVVANVLARENQRARLALSAAVGQEPTLEKPTLVLNLPVVITGTTDATKVRFASKSGWLDVKARPDISKENWTGADLNWTNAGVVSAGEQDRVFRVSLNTNTKTVEAYIAGLIQAGILVRVEYCDAFKRRHYITRCATRNALQPNGLVTYCGVDTDQNTREQGQPECQP